MEKVSFTLDGKLYSVTKPGLRKWLELEETNKQVIDFMRDKNVVEASNSICSYLSCVLDVDVSTFFWKEVAEAYIQIAALCIPSIDFPLLHGRAERENNSSWDYDKRTWYLWSHLLASHYGWTLNYIAELYFEDAIALLEEIFVEEQLQKEWQWSLSELAYPYNKFTQKSEFKALPRPSWMIGRMPSEEATKVTRIPAEMMPVGIVMKWETDEKIIN